MNTAIASPKTVCLFGARSLIGGKLIPKLQAQGFDIHAFSRQQTKPLIPGITWHTLDPQQSFPASSLWISSMPLWELPKYFSQLEAAGIQRLIAFSSTSRITKADSLDPSKFGVAKLLADAEAKIEAWANERKIQWTILRPTLIYDEGKDRNISAIASFIRKFGFFPVAGGNGLRMPVYAEDLADAVMQLLEFPTPKKNYYNLSGGESLTYYGMVIRVFEALHKKPRILRIPPVMLANLIRCMRVLPPCRHWTPGMALRMEKHQAFSCEEAMQDFSYNPRKFYPVFL